MLDYIKEPLPIIKEKIRKLLIITNINSSSITDIEIEAFYDLELERLLNLLNQDKLPQGLINILSYRVLGRIIKNKLSLNKFEELKNSKFEDLITVSEIKEYETNVKFSTNSTATSELDKINKYVDLLCDLGKESLFRYRRLIWG